MHTTSRRIAIALICSLTLVATDQHAHSQEFSDRQSFESARRAVEEGDFVSALQCLKEAGTRRPAELSHVLCDEAFRPIMSDTKSRQAIYELLQEHPAVGKLQMVSEQEPGEPFILKGTVCDPEDHPIPGALVALYHTDAEGYYSDGSTSGRNPRLFGFVKTDEKGEYQVRTISPAPYAGSGGPIHIHMSFTAEGFETRQGHRASLFFADDENLRGDALKEIRSDGCAILERTRDRQGVLTCTRHVILRPEK